MLAVRRPLGLLALGTIVAAACSLVNAPDDVIPGPAGGGQTTASSSSSTQATTSSTSSSSTTSSSTSSTSTTSSSTTSSTSSTTTSSSGAGGCKADTDCPVSTSACHAYTCLPGGTCSLGPVTDGAACDDGNPCDGPGACLAGVCQKGPDACAAQATECITATCTPTGCVATPVLDGTGCGMSFCSNGVCKAGHCNITPINEGVACDDKLFCTVHDTCRSGFCVGDPNPCPSGAECVKGTCDEASKSCLMEPIPDNSPCDDGNPCHAHAFCSSQMCIGGLPPTALFTETFADNSQGWTLGTEWQIGHARMGPFPQAGYPDPGFDVTGEGGVAGVEIGGNAIVASPDPTHPPYYLTSPPVNTMVAGSIYLTFYRWLNSDLSPYMTNTVEVSADGSTWTTIWQTGSMTPILDDQWTFQSFDITAFKGTATQFRFGFSIGDLGVFRMSSWNLDHVEVQNAPCPN